MRRPPTKSTAELLGETGASSVDRRRRPSARESFSGPQMQELKQLLHRLGKYDGPLDPARDPEAIRIARDLTGVSAPRRVLAVLRQQVRDRDDVPAPSEPGSYRPPAVSGDDVEEAPGGRVEPAALALEPGPLAAGGDVLDEDEIHGPAEVCDAPDDLVDASLPRAMPGRSVRGQEPA